MLPKLLNLARVLFNFGQQTQKNQAEIEALREENRELTGIVHRLYYDQQRLRDEMQHLKEGKTRERDNLALRLENEMLRFEKRLPPHSSIENRSD